MCIYRPEHNAKGEPHGIVPEIYWNTKWNMPADSALRVNERNGVICLVITFGPRVLVIKMSKMADFLYILLMKGKIKQSQFGQNI